MSPLQRGTAAKRQGVAHTRTSGTTPGLAPGATFLRRSAAKNPDSRPNSVSVPVYEHDGHSNSRPVKIRNASIYFELVA